MTVYYHQCLRCFDCGGRARMSCDEVDRNGVPIPRGQQVQVWWCPTCNTSAERRQVGAEIVVTEQLPLPMRG